MKIQRLLRLAFFITSIYFWIYLFRWEMWKVFLAEFLQVSILSVMVFGTIINIIDIIRDK